MKRLTAAVLFLCVFSLACTTGSVSETATPDSSVPQPTDLDTSRAETTYANFCRVTGTPEELIIDFGLNAAPLGEPPESLEVNHRVVMNFYTAKRFLGALQMSVERHEAAFGPLETDVQKRVRNRR